MADETPARNLFDLEDEIKKLLKDYADRVKGRAFVPGAKRPIQIEFTPDSTVHGPSDAAMCVDRIIFAARYMISEWERDAETKKQLVEACNTVIENASADQLHVMLQAIETKAELLGLRRPR